MRCEESQVSKSGCLFQIEILNLTTQFPDSQSQLELKQQAQAAQVQYEQLIVVRTQYTTSSRKSLRTE